ncbi:endonuclease domain-containing protein [Sphingosinicella soli]|uniref:Very-short-patch-repair endonuclease n=1 Tax=Sphingosinicella soli TaxID=333708 RepID=A0A7W7F5H3_9SPHN|nr:endonuclease domain-containing protein [Sphingosinicella soli]MBB4631281.1 very-short-patch-repair endonuclease [Sphingosinicella soli]
MNTPPLQGRGRGWGVSAERLARNQTHARAMRADPTGPEARLWAHLSLSQLGGYKFRRQALIGTAIADFLCPQKGLIVEVDGDTHVDPAADARRDARLAALGYRVVRISNDDVLRSIDAVLEHLLHILDTTADRRTPHPNPSPEEEGLETSLPSSSGEGPGVGRPRMTRQSRNSAAAAKPLTKS